MKLLTIIFALLLLISVSTKAQNIAGSPNDVRAPLFSTPYGPSHYPHHQHYPRHHHYGAYPNPYYANPGFIPPGYYVPSYNFGTRVFVCVCTRINPWNGMHFLVGHSWGYTPQIASSFCSVQNAFTARCF